MSYFVANQISFNKKNKTFKVKGWYNNIIPVASNWSNEMPLDMLLFEFNSWDIQYRWVSNNKLMKVQYYIDKYYKKIYNYLEKTLWKNIYIEYPFFLEFNMELLKGKDWNKLNITKEQKENIKEELNKLNSEMINKIIEKDPDENKRFYVKLDNWSWPYISSYRGKFNIKWGNFTKKSYAYFTALDILKNISERNPILILDES